MFNSKEKCNYKFKAITKFSYTMDIMLNAKNKMLMNIFQKTATHLKRIKKVNLNPGDVDSIQEFEIPAQYRNLLHTFISPQVKIIDKELRKDNIEIYTYPVTKTMFKRNAQNDWDIVVTIEGDYLDKRP